ASAFAVERCHAPRRERYSNPVGHLASYDPQTAPGGRLNLAQVRQDRYRSDAWNALLLRAVGSLAGPGCMVDVPAVRRSPHDHNAKKSHRCTLPVHSPRRMGSRRTPTQPRFLDPRSGSRERRTDPTTSGYSRRWRSALRRPHRATDDPGANTAAGSRATRDL